MNLVMGSVPPDKAGSASGVVQTGNEAGFALGIALMGSIGTFVYRTQLADGIPSDVPAAAASAARENLTDAVIAAGTLSGHLGTEVLNAAREAFSNGLHIIAAITAAAVAAVAVLIVVQLRRVRPLGHTEPPTDQEGDLAPAVRSGG
jgi:MFS transporter, DHA2 family, multidrug resistance protein